MRPIILVIAAAVIVIVAGTFIYRYVPDQRAPVAPAAAAPSAPAVTGIPVAITVLKQGTDAPQDMGRANYRITNKAQLATLWSLLLGPSGPNPPSVDFSTQEVLAVFDGTHSTGGYTVSIDEVADGATRTVVVTHTAPGPDCVVSQGFTAPYEVIAVPKTSLTLTHVDTAVENDCD